MYHFDHTQLLNKNPIVQVEKAVVSYAGFEPALLSVT